MGLKSFIVTLLFLLSSDSFGGFFLGGYGGNAFDNGEGIEKLEGSALGLKAGWRWKWLALELAQTSYDLETKKGQTDDFFVEKAELKGSGTDLMLRFYPFSYLSFVAGITSLDLEADIVLTNVDGDPSRTASASGDGFYTDGNVLGVGLHLPIGESFEIFGEFLRREWTSLSIGLESDTPDLLIHEWHIGLVWYWGGNLNKK